MSRCRHRILNMLRCSCRWLNHTLPNRLQHPQDFLLSLSQFLFSDKLCYRMEDVQVATISSLTLVTLISICISSVSSSIFLSLSSILLSYLSLANSYFCSIIFISNLCSMFKSFLSMSIPISVQISFAQSSNRCFYINRK